MHSLELHWNEISDLPVPRCFAPESVEELRRWLAENEGPCLLSGNGSKWWMGNVPRAASWRIDLRRLNQVLEHSPGDLTVSVQAGIPLVALNRFLSACGQVLPVDPPVAHDATLGGLIAAGLSGPLQQRYGALRDKVLGIRVVHPDGTATRAGGKVVKNVAGYDLCKLYTGSFGTLAAIVEATLRVSPRWEKVRCYECRMENLEHACRTWKTLKEAPLEPAGTLYVSGQGQEGWLRVRLTGSDPVLDAQTETLRKILPGGEIGPADGVEAGVADFHRNPSPLWLRIEALPATIVDALRCASEGTQIHGVVADLSSRRLHVALNTLEPEDLDRIRRHCARLSAAVILDKAPLALKRQVEVWGSGRQDAGLSRAVKKQLDLSCRFNPGVYVDRI